MRRNGRDCNDVFSRAVIPKNPVGGWGVVFGVGLKHILSVWTLQRGILVRVQGWVAWVGLKISESLADRFQSLA